MIGNRYEYDAMAKCERQLWWYRCLHELSIQKTKAYITVDNPRILDAGCGTGGLLWRLKESGYSNLAGFDLSPYAAGIAQQTSGIEVSVLDIMLLEGAYPPNSFDVIASHDIVSMLQPGQDAEAMHSMLQLLKPGGVLLMNFPALGVFKGVHDIAVGTQQRYSIASVRKMVGGKAVVTEFIYWPFLLSPFIFLVRLLQKLQLLFQQQQGAVSDVKMPAGFVNRFFYRVTALENRLLATKPWGSSLFVVLKKSI
jgi:SAM-dependent methyltransferase